MNHLPIPLRRLLLLALACMVAACGFQLRGAADLPFTKLYMQKGNGNSVLRDLRRSLTANGVQIVPTPQEAEMSLELMSETREKEILSLSGGGRVTEYELIYRVMIRLRPAGSELWGPPQLIELRRDYSYDDTRLLAKEGEEERLWNDMRSDAVREIMRRLNAMKASQPAAR